MLCLFKIKFIKYLICNYVIQYNNDILNEKSKKLKFFQSILSQLHFKVSFSYLFFHHYNSSNRKRKFNENLCYVEQKLEKR